MKKIAEQIAGHLLEIEAIRLRPYEPFQWTSGWLSPIYCDNRLTLSYPHIRTFIKNAFVETIQKHFPETECIAGVATAGIPQASLIADAMNLPLIYVRSEAKKHGLGNQIEGKIVPLQKVVVIEDLVSTGGSSVKVIEALRNANFQVLGLVSIMNYGFEQAEKTFEAMNIPFVSLTNFQEVIIEAVKRDLISEKTMAILQEWRKKPENWGKVIQS
ncbi:MAG: orotate phosphoribosyltransferase [Raineya sp.]|nr:orotate phosphoribosyltransferase [Raineya sp.]